MLAAGPSLLLRPALLVIVGRRVGGSTASAAKFIFAPPPSLSREFTRYMKCRYIFTLGPKKVENHCASLIIFDVKALNFQSILSRQ